MKGTVEYRFADIHCHVLPGVDDGSKDLKNSIEMLRIAESEGITAMFLTPNFIMEHSVSPERVKKAFSALKAEMAKEDIQIDVRLGNELYYLSGVEEMLNTGRAFTLNGTRYVLVEFGPGADYVYIRNSLVSLQRAGYKPIIAHVERYQKLLSVEKVRFLRDSGVRIQVNAASISGEAGFFLKRFVKKLLDNGLVDYVGTDAHSTGKRSPRVAKCMKVLMDKYDDEYVADIVYRNTMSLFQTKE